MRAVATILLAGLLVFGAGAATTGCSSHTTTTTRTVDQQGGDETAERTETTTTEKEHEGPHLGIISGTIHAIGWVLALPFRIVGGLIRLIF
jgi:hypothetical protein